MTLDTIQSRAFEVETNRATERSNLSYNKLAVSNDTVKCENTAELVRLDLTLLFVWELTISSLANLVHCSYIQGNDINNFTVNATTFGQIEELEGFKVDLPSESAECISGQWKTTHNARFCVADNSSSGSCCCYARSLMF